MTIIQNIIDTIKGETGLHSFSFFREDAMTSSHTFQAKHKLPLWCVRLEEENFSTTAASTKAPLLPKKRGLNSDSTVFCPPKSSLFRLKPTGLTGSTNVRITT